MSDADSGYLSGRSFRGAGPYLFSVVCRLWLSDDIQAEKVVDMPDAVVI